MIMGKEEVIWEETGDAIQRVVSAVEHTAGSGLFTITLRDSDQYFILGDVIRIPYAPLLDVDLHVRGTGKTGHLQNITASLMNESQKGLITSYFFSEGMPLVLLSKYKDFLTKNKKQTIMDRFLKFLARIWALLFNRKKKSQPPPDDDQQAQIPSPPSIVDEEDLPPQTIKAAEYYWIIAAGHDRNTPGKRSPVTEDGRQFFEWQFNKEVARMVVGVGKELGRKVDLLNPEDTAILIKDRVARADEMSKKYPDLQPIYIDIHSNAPHATHLDKEGWIKKELEDEIHGVEVFFHQSSVFGHILAKRLSKNLAEALGWRNRGAKPGSKYRIIRKNHDTKGGLRTPITTLLVEIGFFVNRKQFEDLMTEDTRAIAASSILNSMGETEDIVKA